MGIDARLPIAHQVFGGVDVLREEAILVRHFQKVEHGLDHVQVRDEDRLRQVLAQSFVLGAEPQPDFGRDGLQRLIVQFRQVQPRFEAVVHLKGLQLVQRNRAEQGDELALAKL